MRQVKHNYAFMCFLGATEEEDTLVGMYKINFKLLAESGDYTDPGYII